MFIKIKRLFLVNKGEKMMLETTKEIKNETINNQFNKIHERLDKQSKKIDNAIRGLFFIGFLIIIFS